MCGQQLFNDIPEEKWQLIYAAFNKVIDLWVEPPQDATQSDLEKAGKVEINLHKSALKAAIVEMCNMEIINFNTLDACL